MTNGTPAVVKDDAYWGVRIYTLKSENPDWGEPRISRALTEEFEVDRRSSSWSGSSPPPPRTVSRRLQDWGKLGPAQKAEYRFARWPESFESGALPWEAAASVLELLRYLHKLGAGRPLVRLAKWYWRVSLAAPGGATTDIGGRVTMAVHLAAQEALGAVSGAALRPVEWYLAFTPWRSEEAAGDYQDAVDGRFGEPIATFTSVNFEVTAGTPETSVLAALAVVENAGIRTSGERAMRRTLEIMREARGKGTANEPAMSTDSAREGE